MTNEFRLGFEKISVPVFTIDDVLKSQEVRNSIPKLRHKGFFSKNGGGGVIFLKIDAEGNELKVLQGAKKLLTESNVIGYFEYSYGWRESSTTLEEAFHYLDDLGFNLHRLTPMGVEHLRFFSYNMENYIYQNFFFCPRLNTIGKKLNINMLFEFTKTDFYLFR